MTTATETTQRYFGRCRIKGCKTRRIVNIAGHSIQHNDEWWNLNDHVFGICGAERRRFWEAMSSRDLVCIVHEEFLYWQGLRATYNPEKICSAKCMNASRPACECSCGGENHGGGNVIHLT